jgi:hypothetical protein
MVAIFYVSDCRSRRLEQVSDKTGHFVAYAGLAPLSARRGGDCRVA